MTLRRYTRWIGWSSLLAILVAASLPAGDAHAQERSDLPAWLFDAQYRSSRTFEKKAIHDGNQIAITFFNYGLLGGVGEIRGNWPKGTNDFYVGDVLPVVALEVPIDLDGDSEPDTLVQHAVTTRGPRAGTNSPPGQPNIFWGFEAKPGFAAPEPNEKPALSTEPETWPEFWPDQPDWIDPATGRAQWNGFFGRGIRNADLESYFWMDDHNDEELFSEFGFIPDTLDTSRRGQGLEVKVRGLQWSQFLAQDALFVLYEVTNTSTTTYPRVAVGLTAGTLAGGDGDSQDDLAFFDQANRIVYSWDFDNSGNEGQDVGYVGYGFMESPGDPDNAIDDDGDGDPLTEQGRDIDGNPFVPGGLEGEGNVFNQADFQPRTLQSGDPLILIDDETGERSVTYLGDGPTTVVSQGIEYTVSPGDELEEVKQEIRGQIETVIVTERNLIDEDLDGIIDEDINLHFERRRQAFTGEIVTLPSLRYENWTAFAEDIRDRAPTRDDSLRHGMLNPMLDERGDDGIDNDGDWDPIADDVGADGVAGTGDMGEGDGVPSPGEPNFDDLDVDETDQVGLTSFFYFTPPGALRMNDDERLWQAMNPGFFTTNQELEAQQAGGGVDGDFIFSSGYFEMPPGRTLRFSMALVFGENLEDITNNAITIQEIFDRNYNFARPPERPTLSAVPGNGEVLLYWDSASEESEDPVLGRDFQGYKLYKSTDPFFRDPEVVTDAFGTPALLDPIVQFDLDDNIDGFWLPSADNNLYERVRGTPFYLGEDTGLRYSFRDSLVENGRDYYYALTSYDRGDSQLGFYPAENNFAVSVDESGDVITGQNVVEVRPNAPVAGFEQGGLSQEVVQEQGPATGDVFVEVLDPRLLTEGTRYTITFDGNGASAQTFSVDSDEGMLVNSADIGDAPSVIFDGQRIVFRNDATRLNQDSTGYAAPEGLQPLQALEINVGTWRYEGVAVPFDYEVRFADDLVGESIGGFKLGTGSRAPEAEARETNFTVYNVTLDRPASFVFFEPSDPDGVFNGNEFIFIYEEIGGELQPTFGVRTDPDATGDFPGAGDVFAVRTFKPFSPSDRYAYRTASSKVSEEEAQAQLDRVKVVPNPYVAAAAWEDPLPPTITSGRGERRVDFIHVPADSRIRIYNSRGELVRELRHDSGIGDGTVSWDLRSREDLDVAYGVYFYHLDAPGIGET
ncbi:MAG: hypothetical protein GVY18_00855, partial [Bacteroidetes bacterium]|nr:hypothetical protein [Bacteroidota bacterium]